MSKTNGNGKPKKTPIGGPTGGTLKKEWATPFLKALEEYANVAQACRIAGIHTTTAYKHKRKDKDFKEAWTESLDQGIATLEVELRRRALHGVDELIFGKDDQIIGTKTKYSDTLGMFLLKAHKPDVYRENVTMDMRHSGTIEVRYAGMTVDEKKADIANRLRGLLSEG